MLFVAVVLGGATLGLYRVRVDTPTYDPDFPPPGVKLELRPVSEISEGVTVRQELVATQSEIHGVRVQLATYGRSNEGTLTLRVERQEGGTWTCIGEKRLKNRSLVDNAHRRFRFSPPLLVEPGQRLAVAVTADGDSSNAITWWMDQGWSPIGTRLSVNDTEVIGAAHLTIIYAGIPVLFYLPEIWSRVSVFFGPIGLSLFFAGLVFSCVGMIGLLLSSPWLSWRPRTQSRDAAHAAGKPQNS